MMSLPLSPEQYTLMKNQWNRQLNTELNKQSIPSSKISSWLAHCQSSTDDDKVCLDVRINSNVSNVSYKSKKSKKSTNLLKSFFSKFSKKNKKTEIEFYDNIAVVA
jgi:hypothetical protein